MIKVIVNKSFGTQSFPCRYKVVLPLISIIIAAYGVYAFLKNDIASYMFLKSMFVFFDPEQSAILFYTEYLAMMVLFACIAYYFSMLLQTCTHKKHYKEIN